MTLTSTRCFQLFGSPLDDARTTDKNEQTVWEMRNMAVYQMPQDLLTQNPKLPKKFYANKVFGPLVIKWLYDLKTNGVLNEITEWNGIFVIRLKRGLSSLSLHSYGVAVDVNASQNPLGLTRAQCTAKGLKPFSDKFLAVSRNHFECGTDWKSRPDGMHFQMKG